jgi:peroxin-11C
MSGSVSVILDEICALLDTYKGRDKILRTLCYSTKLIGGVHSNKALAEKFLLFSKHMSNTRATLRLLDDLPMLKYNLEYGFGKEVRSRQIDSNEYLLT